MSQKKHEFVVGDYVIPTEYAKLNYTTLGKMTKPGKIKGHGGKNDNFLEVEGLPTRWHYTLFVSAPAPKEKKAAKAPAQKPSVLDQFL